MTDDLTPDERRLAALFHDLVAPPAVQRWHVPPSSEQVRRRPWFLARLLGAGHDPARAHRLAPLGTAVVVAIAVGAVGGALGLRGQLHAGGGSPTRGTPTLTAPAVAGPAARSSASMAYDAARGTVVLFGGRAPEGGGRPGVSRTTVLGDTWTWDGARWMARRPPASPPARFGAGMAYDASRRLVIIFGGTPAAAGTPAVVTALGDTWAWDGRTWTELHPATPPPALRSPHLAFDALRGRVVLFGERADIDIHQATFAAGQTWTWDGRTWTQEHPSRTPLGGGVDDLTSDDVAGTVVAFGGPPMGDGGVGPGEAVLGETWTWDGATWTQRHPSPAPHARAAASMAYDAATRKVLLFGGRPAGAAADASDTWTWDGRSWTEQRPAVTPDARAGAGMAYDAATATVVLFGGEASPTGAVLDDTWTWTGTTWTRPAPRPVTSPSASGACVEGHPYRDAGPDRAFRLCLPAGWVDHDDTAAGAGRFVRAVWFGPAGLPTAPPGSDAIPPLRLSISRADPARLRSELGQAGTHDTVAIAGIIADHYVWGPQTLRPGTQFVVFVARGLTWELEATPENGDAYRFIVRSLRLE